MGIKWSEADPRATWDGRSNHMPQEIVAGSVGIGLIAAVWAINRLMAFAASRKERLRF